MAGRFGEIAVRPGAGVVTTIHIRGEKATTAASVWQVSGIDGYLCPWARKSATDWRDGVLGRRGARPVAGGYCIFSRDVIEADGPSSHPHGLVGVEPPITRIGGDRVPHPIAEGTDRDPARHGSVGRQPSHPGQTVPADVRRAEVAKGQVLDLQIPE